jgi:hypothetical protein
LEPLENCCVPHGLNPRLHVHDFRLLYCNCSRLASNIEETEVKVVETRRWESGVERRLNDGRKGEKKM